ncbi:MAG: hypothetical protein ACLUZ3_06305, partial [Blautia wexlerae]
SVIILEIECSVFLISYIRIITGVRSFFENLGCRQIGCAAASAEIRRDSICTIVKNQSSGILR